MTYHNSDLRYYFFLTLLVCTPLSASTIDIPNLNTKPVIDGVFSEGEWEQAKKVEINFITRPFEKLPAPVSTSVRVFENGTDLFVAFIAEDPDSQNIRAFLRDRDNGFGGDLVGIKVDPFNDGRLAYQFYVNPLGVQIDSIENEMTGNESISWNGIWYSAGQLTETGYVVEMKIPLRLMSFEESENIKTWAIEFIRFYPRSDNYRLSHVPFDRNNACDLCQMGAATGFAKAKQTQNLSLVPTLVLGQSRVRDPLTDSDWSQTNNQELGLDINWGITPEVTLTGTLNPDFSQVESDVGQLNINRSFALFFDERRPFFVENADYFTSGQNLIYTRNISAPDYGAKITGRISDHSFGLVVANDESTQFLVPGNLGSEVAFIADESVNLATRYRYDYSDAFSIGLLSTLRTADSYDNLVVGLDTRYRITKQDTLRAQIVRSDTQYPEALRNDFCGGDCAEDNKLNESAIRTSENENFTGKSYSVFYDRDTRNYFIRASHVANDADFRADLGFISNVDYSRSLLGGGYVWWNENDWWNRIRVNGDWDITHNDNGELIEKELEARLSIRGDYQTFVEVGAVKREKVGLRLDKSNLAIDNNTTLFGIYSNSFYFETQPNQYFKYEFFTRKGDSIDLANNRLGDQIYFEQELELNLGLHLRVELEHTRSKLDASNQALFTANLYDIRATYQFDPLQFIRLTTTYSEVQRNQENYLFAVDAQSKNLGFQLLYSYKLNPLTKFFLGFSQNAFENDDLNQIEANSRSVFMKFSYGWLPAL